MKGSSIVGLPLGNPDTALVEAKTDFLTSVTARLGYAFDNVLLYAKGGVAMAADRYDVTGSFTGIPFGFTGWKIASAGPRAAAWNGRSRSIGPSMSNTITMGSGTKTIAMSDPIKCFWAMWTSGRTFRSSRSG